MVGNCAARYLELWSIPYGIVQLITEEIRAVEIRGFENARGGGALPRYLQQS